jgi:hypothetical protein
MPSSKKSQETKDANVRGEIARQLDMFAELLVRNQIVLDASPLNKAAAQCRMNNTTGKWKYSLENLLFRRLGEFKTFQNKFDIQNASLELSVVIEGSCDEPNENDPLNTLVLDIVITGMYEGEEDADSACAAWHLDRHIYDENSEEPEFAHPIYHFSFGGLHLEKTQNPLRTSVLLVDTPRLAHPPMDAILGIDFVLTNFMGLSISSVRSDTFYINTVGTMQHRLWKPYVNSLQSFWVSGTQMSLWNPLLIWTQLLAS